MENKIKLMVFINLIRYYALVLKFIQILLYSNFEVGIHFGPVFGWSCHNLFASDEIAMDFAWQSAYTYTPKTMMHHKVLLAPSLNRKMRTVQKCLRAFGVCVYTVHGAKNVYQQAPSKTKHKLW